MHFSCRDLTTGQVGGGPPLLNPVAPIEVGAGSPLLNLVTPIEGRLGMEFEFHVAAVKLRFSGVWGEKMGSQIFVKMEDIHFECAGCTLLVEI